MKHAAWIILWTLAGWVHAQAALVAGPNGGKLVGGPPDQAEVVISEAGFLSVVFLDEQLKPAPAEARLVAVFAQLDQGRQEVAMKREGEQWVSEAPLPLPEGYTLVVQIRAQAEARPVNVRIQYLMHECGGCSLMEYACTCEEH